MDIVSTGDANGQLVRNEEGYLNPMTILSGKYNTGYHLAVCSFHYDEETGDGDCHVLDPRLGLVSNGNDLLDMNAIQQLTSIDVVEDVDRLS